jgi:hypothetical protein
MSLQRVGAVEARVTVVAEGMGWEKEQKKEKMRMGFIITRYSSVGNKSKSRQWLVEGKSMIVVKQINQ